jgi:HSP20 family protein
MQAAGSVATGTRLAASPFDDSDFMCGQQGRAGLAQDQRRQVMFPLMRPLRRLERNLFRRESDPLRLLRNEMESLFGRALEEVTSEPWIETPGWEVTEAEKEVVLRLELPGYEPSEITVTLEGTVLLLRAVHVETPENRRREAEYRFTLPTGLEMERIEVFYRNGVLEVHVPRVPGAVPRRIEVRT